MCGSSSRTSLCGVQNLLHVHWDRRARALCVVYHLYMRFPVAVASCVHVFVHAAQPAACGDNLWFSHFAPCLALLITCSISSSTVRCSSMASADAAAVAPGSLVDRMRGALWGVLIADALSMPVHW